MDYRVQTVQEAAATAMVYRVQAMPACSRASGELCQAQGQDPQQPTRLGEFWQGWVPRPSQAGRHPSASI